MKIIAMALSALALVACGGGGGGGGTAATVTTSASAVEGVYGGTSTGGSYSAFNLLVLENGDFWSLYGTSTTTALSVRGFVQGTGTNNASNNTFTSANAKDFGFAPAVAGTVSATYNTTAKTISGTLTGTSGTSSFSGGPIAGSLYDYSQPASLTTVSGSWSTTSVSGEGIALTIASNGAFTATSSLGCNFSGTVTPRPSGKNVFNVAVSFGAAPCALAGQAATGIAIAYPLANGKTQLLVSVVDGTRTYGSALFGSR